jgi:phage shock protein C
MSAGERRSYRAKSEAEARASELQQAAGRLEEAVQDVLRGAKEDFAGKAAGLIDDTTRRLRGETSSRRRARYSPEPRLGDNPVRTARLYRSVDKRRLGGVCAGFANYFGVEVWVARCIAVTGLLFMPGITMPAYWIAYFMLEDDPEVTSTRRTASRSGRAARRAAKRAAREAQNGSTRFAESYAPHRALRHLTTDLTAAELRLRRMEGHVTSDQYELRKQLHALDS